MSGTGSIEVTCYNKGNAEIEMYDEQPSQMKEYVVHYEQNVLRECSDLEQVSGAQFTLCS